MDVTQIILTGSIVAAGCAMQSMIGFGAGLFIVPLLVWSGLGLQDAVTVSIAVSAWQMAWGAWRHRTDIPWKRVAPIIFCRFLTLPLGVALLGLVVTIGRDAVQQAVGWGLLSAVMLMHLAKVRPRQTVSGGWSATAGLSSGFLGGLLSMGGPPIVLWTMAHDWTPNQARSAIWAINITGLPVVILLLFGQFGSGILNALMLSLICTPLALAGSLLGFRCNGVLSSARLRRASVAVLILIAANAILTPLIRVHPTTQAAPPTQVKPD